ncbi:MAG: GntR family transcriptional regulator [Actinomycetota bacterium]|jgi:DNA-binding GntR family transcriptional regulator
MFHVGPTPERNNGSLGEWAYHVLLEEIVFHDLRPGIALQETELAARLGISRTPVREALRRLTNEGFVTAVPYKGFFVATIDVTDLQAIREVRIALEPKAALLAVVRATPAEREEAGALLAEIDAGALRPARSPRSSKELMYSDRRIHTHIYVCTHNRYMTETLVRHLNLAHRIWSLFIDRVEHLADAVEQHRALLRAVRDGDPTGVEEHVREHILNPNFDRASREQLQTPA